MYTSFFDICAIMGQQKKAPRSPERFPLYRNKNYFFSFQLVPSKAAKASMSPSVVEAAWFWIIGASSLLLEDFLAPEAAFFCSFFSLSYIFEDTAVRQDDSLLASLLNSITLNSSFHPTELVNRLYKVFLELRNLHTVRKSYNSPLIQHFDDSTFVYRAYSEYCFEYIPSDSFFELFVTQASNDGFSFLSISST